MGLFDRFTKPKWQHKDPKVRLEAIKELDDSEILADIAKTDSNNHIRIEAIKKIEDKNFLIDIIKYNEDIDVLAVALDNIKDVSALTDIAKTDSRIYVRCGAINNIKDDSILVDIIENSSDQFLLKSVIDNIGNQSLLIDLAKNHPDSNVRRFACERIDDESILIDIAKNDSEGIVRSLAVRMIYDESTLKYIAKNDSDMSVRWAAVGRIYDDSFLEDIERTESDPLISRDAGKKITKSYTVNDYIYNIALKASMFDSFGADKLIEKANNAFPEHKEKFDNAKDVGIESQYTYFSYSVSCPKCGTEIETFAGFCPSCYYQYHQLSKSKWRFDTAEGYENHIAELASTEHEYVASKLLKEAAKHFPEKKTTFAMIIPFSAK